jgi:Ca2+-binding EF-hand superfamily protein
MTKAQYLDHFARSEAAKAAKAAAGGAPSGPPGAPPGGAPVVVTLGGNTPPPPMGRGPGGFGGPGGPGSPSDDRATQRVKEQDKDGDGRVSFAEADSRLKENFPQLDRNGDGYVDLDEYKAYYASRDQNRGGPGGPGGPGGGWGGNNGGGGWGDPNWANRDQKDPKKETQEPKPVAMRYGFLPKDLPEWFDKYDIDKDGQVALHEWRKAGDDIAKFQEMDLNGDGLITADELLRFNLRQAEEAKIAAINGEGGSFTRPSFASSGGSGGFTLPGATPAAPPSDTKGSSTSSRFPSFPSRSDKGDKGSDKPNPFRDGGGWGKKGKN